MLPWSPIASRRRPVALDVCQVADGASCIYVSTYRWEVGEGAQPGVHWNLSYRIVAACATAWRSYVIVGLCPLQCFSPVLLSRRSPRNMAPKRQYVGALVALSILLLCDSSQASHDERKRDLDFPSCVSDCIQGSGCDAADVKCMCEASQGSFLTDVVVCTYRDCTQIVSVDVLLGPLEFACNVLGESIPDSAVSSAEAAQSSIDHPGSTTTVVISQTTSTGGQTTETATSKVTITLPESTSTSTTNTLTSPQSTGGEGITSTTNTAESSSTGVHLSSGTGSQSESSSSTTTTTTAGPVDPTDSSPFATPINSGCHRKEVSLLIAMLLGSATIVALG
jgi:hypothetical protein